MAIQGSSETAARAGAVWVGLRVGWRDGACYILLSRGLSDGAGRAGKRNLGSRFHVASRRFILRYPVLRVGIALLWFGYLVTGWVGRNMIERMERSEWLDGKRTSKLVGWKVVFNYPVRRNYTRKYRL